MNAADFTPTQIERFWSKVDRSGGDAACWPWIGAQSLHGYGIFWIEVRKPVRASRFLCAIIYGEMPRDKVACHSCDNPSCCNPAHIFVGTQLDNIRDRNAKRRQDHGENAPRWTPPPPRGTARGERAGRAKLTESIVREIRARYSRGSVTQRQLASEYDVDRNSIQLLLSRKTWAHVD